MLLFLLSLWMVSNMTMYAAKYSTVRKDGSIYTYVLLLYHGNIYSNTISIVSMFALLVVLVINVTHVRTPQGMSAALLGRTDHLVTCS
jgi:hypothetical protein